MRFTSTLLLFLITAVARAEATDSHTLVTGDTQVLRLESVVDVVVGNPEVIDVRLIEPNHLAISALREGQSKLVLITDQGEQVSREVRVRNQPDVELELTMAALQQRMPALQVIAEQGFYLLQGEASSRYRDELQSLTQRFPRVLLQVNFTETYDSPMIELEVRIAEIKRQQTRHLGVRWPQQIGGPLFSSEAASAVSFPVDVATTIELLERDGHARLLAQPTLAAHSGGSAEFLVGGEFPVPQVLAQGLQDVSFRDYGIALTMAPHLLPNNQIKTELTAEISSIDPATSVNGIPGILTRRVSSMISVMAGESIVLSGLINHEQSWQADQFPVLHQLPILGQLFSSSQFREAETELVVIVTPTLASMTKKKRNLQHQASEWRDEFRYAVGCVGLVDDVALGEQ
ncbi:hypothetical protein IDSA_11745 [Pseudidiomarina salinarum]|uniref:Uncharacterized protein n=1 Tax=Pseudidiomarina salinarum TaxID=435908 RepID=A0A094ISJ5_9GAMM|nr:pilus assembly protein N-terminal domain-containing protein [Pseudidiomarina salinarum]KFZ30117.1 hypothetical protein IDSA_11745 [Pseudidiomarina salinarum]RUO68240.1 hypothetical protein CWI79_11730 [Pseudidiomarina salinarum]